MKRVILAILFMLPVIVTIVPLLRPEYFVMHDSQHVVRLYLMDIGVRQGQWYPRWVDGLGFGFGYPLFNFYPPFIYIVALLFRFVGFSYVWSIKMMLIVGFIVSYVGMFLLIWQLTKRKGISLLSAVLYLLAPYHSVLVYVRGAFAEFFGYALVPWIMWGFVRMIQNKSSLIYILSLTVLLLTHPFVSFPFMLFFSIVFLITLIFLPNNAERLKIILRTGISTAIALGLSAFYWLPSMVERSQTLVNKILLTQDADYREHFIYFRQLWNSAWGYGGSSGFFSGLSFEIGKVHLILVVIGTGVFLWAVFKKKVTRKHAGVASCLMTLFLISVFLTNIKSRVIWDYVELLAYLQFPWRMLVFIVFFASMGASLWLIYIRRHTASIVIFASIFFAIIMYGPLFQPKNYISGRDMDYITDDNIRWNVSRSSFEFMYKDVESKKNGSTTEFALKKNELSDDLYTKTGAGLAIVKRDYFHEKIFKTESTIPVIFVLSRSYFPGWQAYIDGNKTDLRLVGKARLMEITVPEGEHVISFKFENTPIRIFAGIISILSLVFFLYFVKKEGRFFLKTGEFLNKSKR